MEHLLIGWWGAALFACSCIIFYAYQVIPSGLLTIEDHARCHDRSPWLLGITSSIIFRAFIRVCGANHLIMTGIMVAVANHWITPADFWRGILLGGEAIVAAVSFLSALAVWKTKWHLMRT